MKLLKKLTIIFAVLYTLFCIIIYNAQDNLIFDPSPLEKGYQFRMGEEVNLEVADDLFINCVWIKENPNPKGVILYLHGNRGSNRRCLRQAQTMLGNDYDIFMPDYRGYGKSDGAIESEAQLFADIEKVYNYVLLHYDESQIVIVGYSLGSGMASYLASQHNPQQLILLAAYRSFIDLKDRMIPIVPDFLLKYPLNTEQYLPLVTCPTTLFHGVRDDIIPFESSEKLQTINPELITLVRVEGEGHRGIIFSGAFRNGVRRLLE